LVFDYHQVRKPFLNPISDSPMNNFEDSGLNGQNVPHFFRTPKKEQREAQPFHDINFPKMHIGQQYQLMQGNYA